RARTQAPFGNRLTACVASGIFNWPNLLARASFWTHAKTRRTRRSRRPAQSGRVAQVAVSCPCEGRGPVADWSYSGSPLEQCRIEISPVGVHLLDLAQFPDSLPLFHLERAQARFLQIVVTAVPNQQFASMFLGEAFDQTIAVLPHALHEGRRRADVKRAVSTAGHDIDVT